MLVFDTGFGLDLVPYKRHGSDIFVTLLVYKRMQHTLAHALCRVKTPQPNIEHTCTATLKYTTQSKSCRSG